MTMSKEAVDKVSKKKAVKLSPEEIMYNETVELMDAVEFTSRFERTVLTLQSAADSFEKLGDFKDSKSLAQKCRKMAEDAKKAGTKAVYEKAVDRQKKAKIKSDYDDAIENFNRVKKYKYNVSECNEHIKQCEKAISHLETIAAYKRRGIAVAILAALLIVFVNTPFFPLLKGVIHQSRGEYVAAIANYKAAHGILGGSGKMKKCYCALGDEAYRNGDYEKALDNYKKAEDKLNAPVMKRRLEQMYIEKAEPGDSVILGKTTWIVLDKDGDNALLIKEDINKQVKFDKGKKTSWLISSYRNWLNKKYKLRFSSEERAIMVEQYIDKPAKKGEMKERFFPLTTEQYVKYQNIIPKVDNSYWLKDGSIMNGQVKVVRPDGKIEYADPDDPEIYTRQACVVNFNIKQADKERKAEVKEKPNATPYPDVPK